MDAPFSSSAKPQQDRCCVCKTLLHKRYESVLDPQTYQQFAIHGCSNCGMGHTSPQPPSLDVYYGKAYYGNRHGFTKRFCMRRRVALLNQAHRPILPSADFSHGRRLLDVGCGDGAFLRVAQKHGWLPCGTELGGNSTSLPNSGIPIYREVAAAVQAQRYDAVTMWHSLEHFRDVNGTIADVRAALRPGGTLIIAVPDAGGLQARFFGEKWLHLDVPRHLFHFTRASLSQLLAQHDLHIESWRHQEAEMDVFGWMQSALNRLLPVPNVLFHALTGKPTHASLLTRATSYAVGSCLLPLSVAATATSAMLKRGGTLVAVARAPL